LPSADVVPQGEATNQPSARRLAPYRRRADRLAKVTRLGHIRPDGEVAERLKAAVC
jgi:hypothetical protein